MDKNPEVKKNQRISKQQKQTLVEYMANHLEFARGQFGSMHANSSNKEQWETLRNTLNSLGGSHKTIEQWKKCWIDLKSGVKSIMSKRRMFMNQTGGGSFHDAPRDLNHLEEKILSIITIDAVDGDGRTPESGLYTDESMLSIEVIEGDEISLPKDKIEEPMEKVKEIKPPRNTSGASKYNEALHEAREMHSELLSKINAIERQNQLMLQSISKLDEKLNTFLV
ncbi:uncharacterized protein LOC142223084 [Haematobia irritans]|uniref:uncharacterized protein LOC142223084 n=1 Tax=Haematobia irritans TaxID=7368 RepID=UPI003F50968A